MTPSVKQYSVILNDLGNLVINFVWYCGKYIYIYMYINLVTEKEWVKEENKES